MNIKNKMLLIIMMCIIASTTWAIIVGSGVCNFYSQDKCTYCGKITNIQHLGSENNHCFESVQGDPVVYHYVSNNHFTTYNVCCVPSCEGN